MSGVIVHEWLARTGGSENVFETLGEIFPDASRYCLWNDSGDRFVGVHETVLARAPFRKSKALALPLMPSVWRHLPVEDAEWIICSSHAFAHHARFRGPARAAPKLVYAHTPARYVWAPELDGRGGGIAGRAVSAVLRPIDRRRAQEPIAIAANSKFIAARIADSWERESTVIYPPVDVSYFASEQELTGDDQGVIDGLPGEYLFGVSRLVPYKRLDLVLEMAAATRLPAVIAGDGPDQQRLRAVAEERGARVQFLGRTSRSLLAELYRNALAVVFAPIEDFGIIPVEAMATGTPVIVNAVGGASESVVDGVTGATISEWEPRAMHHALERALAASRSATRGRAEEFGRSVFDQEIRAWLARYAGSVE